MVNVAIIPRIDKEMSSSAKVNQDNGLGAFGLFPVFDGLSGLSLNLPQT